MSQQGKENIIIEGRGDDVCSWLIRMKSISGDNNNCIRKEILSTLLVKEDGSSFDYYAGTTMKTSSE